MSPDDRAIPSTLTRRAACGSASPPAASRCTSGKRFASTSRATASRPALSRRSTKTGAARSGSSTVAGITRVSQRHAHHGDRPRPPFQARAVAGRGRRGVPVGGRQLRGGSRALRPARDRPGGARPEPSDQLPALRRDGRHARPVAPLEPPDCRPRQRRPPVVRVRPRGRRDRPARASVESPGRLAAHRAGDDRRQGSARVCGRSWCRRAR